MKLLDINTIIEQTISTEIKSRILKEQDESNELIRKIKSLKSIAPLSSKIINVVKMSDNDEFGVLIDFEGITEEELTNCCGVSSVDETVKILTKNIQNDLINNGLSQNADIDINLDDIGNGINMKISITNNTELGSETINNMKDKEINEFNDECVECDQPMEETEVPCDECDDELNEQDATDDPGMAYYQQVMSQYKDEPTESELSGVNGTDNIVDSSSVYESKKNKKVIRMTEEKVIQLITKMVQEVQKPKVVGEEPKVNTITKPYQKAKKTPDQESAERVATMIPGLQAVKKAHEGDKKESDEYMSSVDKKMKDYLSFKGNDNPEFPEQVGEGEKVAYRNTTDDDEYVETYRGMGLQDAKYDVEPSKEFVDRVKKALSGDKTMGNSQDKDTVNVIPSKTGEKVFKSIDKKRKSMVNDPMYVKDPTPVVNTKPMEDDKKPNVVNEEIQRMKEILSYNKKTQ